MPNIIPYKRSFFLHISDHRAVRVVYVTAPRSDNIYIIAISRDTVPPIVTGSPDRAPDSNGWYNHPVKITWY
jgi:hypothetical protein